jgi:hypothetical protein
MREHTINDGLARKFLLGQLSPEEQGRIEALAFSDPDVFLFLQAAEDDLVDDSLYGELSSDEKEAFENHFLTRLDRRRDLRIARALKQYLAEDHQPAPLVSSEVIDAPPNPWSFLQRLGLGSLTGPLVAIVIVLIGASSLVFRLVTQTQGPPLRAQQQQSPAVPTPGVSSTATPLLATPTPVPKDAQKPSPSPRQPSVPLYATLLTPGGSVRSAGAGKTLPLPAGAVQFELPVIDETPYPSYQALLQKDNQTIHSWSNLHTQELTSGTGVQIIVRPGLLQKAQRYRIIVNGVPSTGRSRQLHTYHFEIAD